MKPVIKPEMKKDKRNHLNLLCDVGDLANLLSGSANIDGFLQQTVEMIARYLETDVCTIYLHEKESNELVLSATCGLNPESVGKIRLKPGEGLVGLAFGQSGPVCEGDALNNPNFKYFREANEDQFCSFLAVPIYRDMLKIGVLVVQHEAGNYFDEVDILALRAIASQLASSIENAGLLMALRRKESESISELSSDEPLFIKGEAASEGFSIGPATIFKKNRIGIFNDGSLKDETYSINDFKQAIKVTAGQLKELQTNFASKLPESASLIFTAHFMILKDPSFIGKMEENILKGFPVLRAVRVVVEHYIDIFSKSPHEYIRDKVNDVEDLVVRILKNLRQQDTNLSFPSEHRIVIANQLYPSDVLKLVSEDVAGIILVSGGVTSHIAILSRSLHIPLIIAEDYRLLSIPENTPVIIDAEQGNIYINPSREIIQQFETKNRIKKTTEQNTYTMLPVTKTKDGVRVRLMANINLLSEIKLALKLKAEGIGLYRTEFPFLIRSTFPSETEQYLVYKCLLDGMKGYEVTIRTLDVGGEKMLAYSNESVEANPELGLRSIRFSLRHQHIFKNQIRAILRAAFDSERLRIMFPMISSLDEFEEARGIVYDCIRVLEKENLPHHSNPAIGVMIELPAVVEIIDEFVEKADFFAIGTNDFVQYMLAVDRTNRKVSDYYCSHHPSVIRALTKIVNAAVKAKKDISVCGEMAHEPEYIPFLLGIGVRKLSVDPQFLPAVQKKIIAVQMSDAVAHADRLKMVSTLEDAKRELDDSAS